VVAKKLFFKQNNYLEKKIIRELKALGFWRER
jgi:hypothetical protein